MQINSIQSKSAPLEITVQNFVAEVVQASAQMPVVLYFYSPGSAACSEFSAVLEQFLAPHGGVIKLARVNMANNTQIAAQFGIQALPTTYVVFQGQPVDGFAGALPAAELQLFFTRFLQGGANPEEDIKAALTEAARLLEEGGKDEAMEIYLTLHHEFPEHADAAVGAASTLMALGKTAQAEMLMNALTPTLQTNPGIISIKARLAIAHEAGSENSDALETMLAKHPQDHKTRLKLAVHYFAAGRTQEAIDALLFILGQDREWNERAAHKQLLTFFEALGPMHPHSAYGRRRLSSLLFS